MEFFNVYNMNPTIFLRVKVDRIEVLSARFVTGVEFSPKAIEDLEVGDLHQVRAYTVEIVDKLVIPYVDIKNDLVASNTTLYYLVGKDGLFKTSPVNVLKESSVTKENHGEVLANRYGSYSTVLKVYVPFKDSPLDDYIIEGYCDADTLVSDLVVKESIYNGNMQHRGHLSVDITEVVSSTDTVNTFTVQLVDDEKNPVALPDYEIKAKVDKGYLINTKAYTDTEGKAVFKFIPLYCEAGDVCTIKYGFQFLTNQANTKVTVS